MTSATKAFKVSEKDLQRTILSWLAVKRIFAYKNNTVGIWKQATQTYIPSPSRGAPDIVAIFKGVFCGVECKSTGGRQSDHQKLFQQEVEKAGGIYILADSFESFEKQFKEAFGNYETPA